MYSIHVSYGHGKGRKQHSCGRNVGKTGGNNWLVAGMTCCGREETSPILLNQKHLAFQEPDEPPGIYIYILYNFGNNGIN